MFITQKNKLKLNKGQYKFLLQLSHASKDLYNTALYLNRQQFFERGTSLDYLQMYHLLKNHPNYKILPSDVAQYTLKIVERAFRAFYGLLKKKKQGNYNRPARLPKYLPKDGHFILIWPRRKKASKTQFHTLIPKAWQKQHNFKRFTIPIPQHLHSKTIKEIRIVPKHNGLYFNIEYVYQQE